jgi:sulfide:quinone oxidoreductase
MSRNSRPFAVVICGGGTAGIEGLLRLHRLAGEFVELTLLCPDDWLFYRPEAVLESFTLQPTHPYPISRIAADTGTHWVRDALAWVDRTTRTVHTTSGTQLAYDALLLAVGGRERRAGAYMDVFTDQASTATYRGILDDIEAARITHIAYVRPDQPSWPLPLYELALLTAKRARDVKAELKISFITREPEPVHAFGSAAAKAVATLMSDAGITLHTGADVEMPAPQHLILQPGRMHLHPDRTVTLPTITGPNVRGIPGDSMHRFLAVDPCCRVLHTDGRIFAAGDATDMPLKHGGVGAQQADTAAAAIAHLAGALGEPPPPLHPIIRGELLTGSAPLYLEAQLIAGHGFRTHLYDHPPWLADEQLVTEELAPYLRGLRAEALAEGRSGAFGRTKEEANGSVP